MLMLWGLWTLSKKNVVDTVCNIYS